VIEGYTELNPCKTYLITGSAGFIGFFLSKKLLSQGCQVIGLDNLNDYYDLTLKRSRLKELKKDKGFVFIKGDISDKKVVSYVFSKFKPQIVVNLAAQAGVRYSFEQPDTYIQSNIIGFYNILEACRHSPVEHLIYASSSSVYGANTKVPYSTQDKTDNPVSLYAATKKSNELMAHAYSHLYNIPTTGLRFFTVYGPLGRPDMAYFSFTEKLLQGKPIKVFNYGNCFRDFTYIDDVVEAVTRILCNPPIQKFEKGSILDGIQYAVYNVGNSQPVQLVELIRVLEQKLSYATGRKIMANIEFLPRQPGDVITTYSNSTPLEQNFGFKPETSLEEGLEQFVNWYIDYFGVK